MRITGCPLKKITNKSFVYVNLYHFYKRREYPNPGEWFRQPLKYLAAMKHIEFIIEKNEQEEYRNARQGIRGKGTAQR